MAKEAGYEEHFVGSPWLEIIGSSRQSSRHAATKSLLILDELATINIDWYNVGKTYKPCHLKMRALNILNVVWIYKTNTRI